MGLSPQQHAVLHPATFKPAGGAGGHAGAGHPQRAAGGGARAAGAGVGGCPGSACCCWLLCTACAQPDGQERKHSKSRPAFMPLAESRALLQTPPLNSVPCCSSVLAGRGHQRARGGGDPAGPPRRLQPGAGAAPVQHSGQGAAGLVWGGWGSTLSFVAVRARCVGMAPTLLLCASQGSWCTCGCPLCMLTALPAAIPRPLQASTDPGTSVRKSAIKILWESCIRAPGFPRATGERFGNAKHAP